MSKKKQNYSIEDSYSKVYVRGSVANPFGEDKPSVNITVTELSYEANVAVARLSVKEAKQLIGLLEDAIKVASAKNKKVGKK